MKKILFALMCILLFAAAAVNAEEIKVEGENYSSANFAAEVRKDMSEFSNSSILWSFPQYEKGKINRVTYKVTVKEKGGYNLKAVTTYIGANYTSDYWVVVNGKEEIQASRVYEKIKNISSSHHPSLFAQYDLGLIHLEEGENTISFEARGDDVRSDGYIVMWIDCFSVEYIPFGIYSIKAYKDLNVYERDDKAEFGIEFSSDSEKSLTLPFEVKNFWRQTVLKGKLSVKAGTRTAYLNLNKMEVGWYTLEVDYNGQKKTAKFSVTRKENEYTTEDTPFACDMASSVLKSPQRDIAKYARAARLAGIGWVRERFDYPSFNTAQDVYNTNVDLDKRTEGKLRDAGLKVSTAFTGSPAWSVKRGYYPENYFNVYNSFYNAAKTYGSVIKMWECWNEEDTAFASEPADEYAAFMKSFAIGIVDAGVGALPCIGGFALGADETTFMDLCMQNGLLDYMAAYNCHVYGRKTSQDILASTEKEELDSHINLINTYGAEYDMPIWVTEGGMSKKIPQGTNEMTWASEKELAPGAVISVAQSVARGTGKHFWFLLCPYYETTYEYGVFSANGEPHPVYSAYANMIYQLREGKYKGKVAGLPDGAEGFMFDNGDNDVAVIWSDNETSYDPGVQYPLRVADLMGKEITLPAGSSVKLSKYPVYIHFNGKADDKNYIPVIRSDKKIESLTFSEAQRVVMCQRFYGQNYDTPRTDGYTILGGEDNICTIEVYNYNDHEITAEIKGVMENDGYEFAEDTKTVTVGAKSVEKVKFVIRTTDSVKYDVTQYMRFEGTVSGEPMSPSVSRIVARSPFNVEPDGLFPNSQDLKNWNVKNASSGSVVTAKPNPDASHIEFKIEYGSGDKWAYPSFEVDDASMLRDTTGICFNIEKNADFTAFGLNVFLDLSDGRRYFLGNDNMMDVITQQYKLPWTKFIMFSSPLGVKVDTRQFDPTLITRIEIGGNRRASVPEPPRYTVSDVGWYTSDFEASTAEAVKIDITGITDGAVYQKGSVPQAYAQWSDGMAYKKIGVKLGKADFDSFTVSGNTMTIDLSGLDRGCYRMMVYAVSRMDYVYKDYIYFDVQ